MRLFGARNEIVAALFVNAAAKDFRLTAGSPAIDTGTSLGADVPTDIDGTTRPQRLAYDIGCYEMPSSP